MREALGVLETTGLTPTMAAVDAMEKAAEIRVVQCELNDFLGVVTKIAGPVAAVETAVEAGRSIAETLGGRPIALVIARPDARAWEGIRSPRTFNPLVEQDVVFFPHYEPASAAGGGPMMAQETSFALGFIETQGFTAVFEAIDTACKAANVEVVGKEKLGGGYIAVIIKGDLSAVHAAIAAGREKVEGLGKLIAAHVLARPSESVLALLPK
jgi:microcompartment protein CcmL/EutN